MLFYTVIGLVLPGLTCCLAQTAPAVAPPSSPAAQWSCRVAGFSFRPNVFPRAAGTQQSPVQLFSLPFTQDPSQDSVKVGLPPAPLATLRAAAAACRADAACGMFTSDGYLVGAYRTDSDLMSTAATANAEADIITWQPMHYCTRRCCGTWVANGLLAQLLRPISTSNRGVAQLVLDARLNELPRDSDLQYSLKPSLLSTTCAATGSASSQLPAATPSSGPTASVSSSSNPSRCPQRCLVACCKQLAAGDYSMGPHHFSQCSGSVCKPCGFAGSAVAASAVESVLARQYMRERWRRDARLGATSSAESRG